MVDGLYSEKTLRLIPVWQGCHISQIRVLAMYANNGHKDVWLVRVVRWINAVIKIFTSIYLIIMLSVIVHLSTRKMEQETLSLSTTLLRYLLVQPPGCLDNTILFNLGPSSARLICPDKLRATSVSHPSSHPNSSLGFAGGKYLQKIIIPIFRLVVQNVAPPGYFALFYRNFPPTFPWLFGYCSM